MTAVGFHSTVVQTEFIIQLYIHQPVQLSTGVQRDWFAGPKPGATVHLYSLINLALPGCNCQSVTDKQARKELGDILVWNTAVWDVYSYVKHICDV